MRTIYIYKMPKKGVPRRVAPIEVSMRAIEKPSAPVKHTAVFESTVDVPNVINFCADAGRHLIDALSRTFNGRCYNGMFITEVQEVLQRSRCRIASTNTSGGGFIDVQFCAAVSVVARWDILVGVKIVSTQQMAIGTYSLNGVNAIVNLKVRGAAPVAVGQTVAVRVLEVEHAPMQSQVSVVGMLLTCEPVAVAYALHGALEPAARAELEPLLRAIRGELELRALIPQARLDHFESLLYSFSGAPPGAARVPTTGAAEWVGPAARAGAAGGAPVNILEIAQRAVDGESVPVTGAWSRPLNMYRSAPLALFAPDRGAAIESTPRAVFALMLKNMYDFLRAVREMVALYDPELTEANQPLWAVMRAAQVA